MNKADRFIFIAIALAGLIMTIVAGIQAAHRQSKKDALRQTAEVNDFDRWLIMTPQFLYHGADYKGDSFPNPPIVLEVFKPFTWVSPPAAQFLWVLCKFIFAAGVLVCAINIARNSGTVLGPPAVGLMLATWLWPVLGDMQEGQTNLLMLLPLAAGLWAAQQPSRRWQICAGLLVALAVCVKVTPIIFLIYFLFRRRWLLSLAMLLGLVLWLLPVPALFFGWRQNLTWLGQWYHIMIVPFVVHAKLDYYVGQSVSAFLSRLLRHVPAFVSHKHTAQPYPVYVNIVSLPGKISDWIIRLLLVAMGLTGLWWMRRPLKSLQSRRYLLDIGAIAAFMVLASPRTWVPHYVTLIFTLAAVSVIAFNPATAMPLRKWAIGALSASGFLMFMTTDIGKLFGPDGHRWLLTIGVSLWATLLLLLVILCDGLRRDPDEGSVIKPPAVPVLSPEKHL